jgi:hypothetical protein
MQGVRIGFGGGLFQGNMLFLWYAAMDARPMISTITHDRKKRREARQ